MRQSPRRTESVCTPRGRNQKRGAANLEFEEAFRVADAAPGIGLLTVTDLSNKDRWKTFLEAAKPRAAARGSGHRREMQRETILAGFGPG
jgi:hypothetical protein